MRTVLTIAGSDSIAGAGIQADLKTFAALGLYGASAITAITAQNTVGVVAVEPLAADLVTAQIEAVAGDLELHATKVGMLANAAIAEAVAAAIEELELPNVVLDPVLASTSGHRLLDDDGVQVMMIELIPRARVITPNVPEAEALSGRRISSLESAHDAARRLHDMGAASVIITGGHLVTDARAEGSGDNEPRPDASRGFQPSVVDVVFDGHTFHDCRVPRVDGRRTHGTGCTFASAVAAFLAQDCALADAASRAQQYVAGAIAHAPRIGRGRGPLDHFWQIRRT